MKNLIISDSKFSIALQTSLLGEIYPEIRAIAYKYDPIKKQFTIRFYLDRKPTDEDYENVSTVMTEFVSYFDFSLFDQLIQECIYSDLPLSKVEWLDGFVYERKEN